MHRNYEKSRNEKMRNMENPFKFGTIVEEEYFTDRVEEVAIQNQISKQRKKANKVRDLRKDSKYRVEKS